MNFKKPGRDTKLFLSSHEEEYGDPEPDPHKTHFIKPPLTSRAVKEHGARKKSIEQPPKESLHQAHDQPVKYEYEYIITLQDVKPDPDLVHAMTKSGRVVTVRRFPATTRVAEKLYWFKTLQNENIIQLLQEFRRDNLCYVVLEHMFMPLSCLIRCDRKRTPDEVGAVIGQILDGLIYLETHNIIHPEISGETVSVSLEGDVKIGFQEKCMNGCKRKDEVCKTHEENCPPPNLHKNAISKITLELMQRVAGEDHIQILFPQDWANTGAMEFLSSTATKKGLSDLRKDTFLLQLLREGDRWPRRPVISLAQAANYVTRRRYNFDKEWKVGQAETK